MSPRRSALPPTEERHGVPRSAARVRAASPLAAWWARRAFPAAIGLLAALTDFSPAASPPPSIVYILADDMGCGDVGALNREGKIPTPHIDRLAREGMVFTDAHSGSAVCTPARYGILTGRYAWRSRLKSGVLWGFSRRLMERGLLPVQLHDLEADPGERHEIAGAGGGP